LAVAAENPKALVRGNKDIINQGKHAVSTNTTRDIVGRYTEVLFILYVGKKDIKCL
jgi:hypothetical protein